MSARHCASYATVFIGSHLHPEGETLDLDWMGDIGDETETFGLDVPTDDPRKSYLGIQAFDMGKCGHEIRINGGLLSGFDIPSGDGWRYWADTAMGASLVKGTNTIRVVRDDEENDTFAVGMMTVHQREPVEKQPIKRFGRV